MNETIKTILNRQSIRAFMQNQIKDEELQIILKAGQSAPSAMNQQSSHFTIVQNKKILQDINQTVRNNFLKSGNKRFEEMAKSVSFSAIYNFPT